MSVTITSSNSETQLSSVDLVFRSLVEHVQSLLDGYHESCSSQLDFSRVDSGLRSLPLAMDDFALCSNRLQNAQRYARAKEHGACKFELRQFIRTIERQQQRYCAVPKRRVVAS